MKKTLCLLLGLALCVPFFALAAGRTVRISGGYVEEYWTENGIRVSTPDYHGKTDAELLQLANPPDVYSTSTGDCDLRALKAAGLLADLSESTLLREAVGRMRPEIQSLLMDEEGHICAVPRYVMSEPIYWHQEAWDAARLTAEDVPQNYTELLDFAERWAKRVQEQPEKDVCFTDTRFFGGSAAYAYTRWLTDILISTWEMQAYEAGAPLDFDTTEFLALLKRTQQVSELLYEAEPNQRECSQRLSLFWNQNGNANDEERYNGGRDDGLSHTMPFRVTTDQPVLMRASVGITMVCAGSELTDAAIGYLERYLTPEHVKMSVEMYSEVAENASIYQGSISAGWLKDRNDYAGIFSFAPRRTSLLYEETLMAFFKGKLSAEELVQEFSGGLDAATAS